MQREAAWLDSFDVRGSSKSNVRVLKLLCRNGADPDHPNSQGTTALMLACQLNNRDCMLELMEAGANIRSVDNFRYTPLAYATSLPVPSHARRLSRRNHRRWL